MKKIFLVAALFLFISTAFCQSFMHGVGITVIGSTGSNNDISYGEGLTYFPRFNFLETESLSVLLKTGLHYLTL